MAANKRMRRRRRRMKNFLWFKFFGCATEIPCHWCTNLFSFNKITIDHEPPLAMGGNDNSVVLSCKNCNEVRGRILARFLDKLIRLTS